MINDKNKGSVPYLMKILIIFFLIAGIWELFTDRRVFPTSDTLGLIYILNSCAWVGWLYRIKEINIKLLKQFIFVICILAICLIIMRVY